jgi:hypothetical protein
MMIDELDLVLLTHDVQEYKLQAGDVGTVVHRYQDGEAFEVEFVTFDGTTVALLTLEAPDIRPIHNEAILHVRDLVA